MNHIIVLQDSVERLLMINNDQLPIMLILSNFFLAIAGYETSENLIYYVKNSFR